MRCWTWAETPVGLFGGLFDASGLRQTVFTTSVERLEDLWGPQGAQDTFLLIDTFHQQIHDYFNGQLYVFDLPWSLDGRPVFQNNILKALDLSVPYGRTCSYGELAQYAGRPGAARAVGRAMATNPLPLILPCHRVLSAKGLLTGYSAGEGVATKQWLLDFEQQQSQG